MLSKLNLNLLLFLYIKKLYKRIIVMQKLSFDGLLILCLMSSLKINSQIFNAKCPDDKTKTNACSFVHTEGLITQTLIFNKCGSDKSCKINNDGYGICTPNIKLRKNGQSCNYNEDCKSLTCKSNECSGVSENGACGPLPGFYCGAGLFCDDSTNICKKVVYSADGDVSDKICGYGLVQVGTKCKKFGSVADGEIGDANGLACKSGLSRTDGTNYICDSITTDATCTSTTSADATWSKGGTAAIECATSTSTLVGTAVFYPKKTKLQSTLYASFLEDYEDLDLEEINTEDKYVTTANYDPDDEFGTYLKWKTKKKFIIYKNAPRLVAAGIMNSEGEAADDKDCEYDFIIKNLSDNYLNISGILIAILGMLF